MPVVVSDALAAAACACAAALVAGAVMARGVLQKQETMNGNTVKC